MRLGDDSFVESTTQVLLVLKGVTIWLFQFDGFSLSEMIPQAEMRLAEVVLSRLAGVAPPLPT